MNRSIATLAAVLIGLAVLFSFLDKPDGEKPQPPEPKANIAAQARESIRQTALEFSDVFKQAQLKADAGEKDADIHAFLKTNLKSKFEASFKPLDSMIEDESNAGRLSKAFGDASTGFGKAGMSIR